MREVLPFVLLACACAATAERRPSAPAAAVATAPSPSAPVSAALAAPDVFDDLVARGPAVASGMRVVAQRASAGEAVDLVRAEAGDVCVRVVFASSAPASASLVSASGEVLAVLGPPATEGVLPGHGPVCVRKGDVVRGLAPGAGHARWVAWVAGP